MSNSAASLQTKRVTVTAWECDNRWNAVALWCVTVEPSPVIVPERFDRRYFDYIWVARNSLD
jgi:hypothetical protein